MEVTEQDRARGAPKTHAGRRSTLYIVLHGRDAQVPTAGVMYELLTTPPPSRLSDADRPGRKLFGVTEFQRLKPHGSPRPPVRSDASGKGFAVRRS